MCKFRMNFFHIFVTMITKTFQLIFLMFIIFFLTHQYGVRPYRPYVYPLFLYQIALCVSFITYYILYITIFKCVYTDNIILDGMGG